MADQVQNQRDAIRNIRTFPQLIKYLRDELEWPIESEDFEELTFDYTPEELGIDTASAAKIQEIKRLRPLSASQPWGIFFVKFEPKRLPVVALRRVLSRVVLKKRASANSADRAAWQADDLLFISNYGEGDERQISFAHFSQDGEKADLPTLKVLGWDTRDTALHLADVADTLHQRLTWPEDDKNAKRWREQWRAAFTLRHGEVITTSKELAVRLADLARAIRARIQMVLAIETEKGPLTKLMKAFQEALIHDLSPDDFSDMYAQTIAYGLLSARVAHPADDTADAVATHIPVTNPFLKELMETFLHLGGRKRKDRGGDGIDFDELGVSDVVALLDAANMEAVVRDFGDRNRDEDPVIHFYELFLKEYDAKKRIQRGVFYTPQAVVSYIVRSVHELLQTEFGLEDGLASTATWGDMVATHANLKIPDGANPGDPFVVILDPATGTATFLVEAIGVIQRTLATKWKQQRLTDAQQRAAWNEYVPKHLLPRLHGFELMMAPYAIAHMKIGLKLYETGYRFGSDERARIYLTNALEPASDDKAQREFEQWVPALAHEAKAVNAIKRHQRFTVVIGNPPYSNYGQLNKIPFILGLLGAYKRGLGEKKINLDDDFIKFIRFSEDQIARTGVGCLGFITNSSYLDGVTHRQMRAHLLETFGRIELLNLHGGLQRGESNPFGDVDENVFDIKLGVAIALFTATKTDPGPEVTYADLWGARSHKYELLMSGRALIDQWIQLAPTPPHYFFVPKSQTNRVEYERGVPLSEAFLTSQNGIKTDRDDLFVADTKAQLVERMQTFFSHAGVKEPFKSTYRVEDSSSYKLLDRRARTRFSHSAVRPCLYRPFDTRWLYYEVGLTSRPAADVMKHMLRGDNFALLACRQQAELGFHHVFITKLLSECCAVSLKTREITSVFPLWRYPEVETLTLEARESNLERKFTQKLTRTLAVSRELSPEDVFHYVYAVLHSPNYRSRYAEFLKIDFPRVPLPGSLDLFSGLSISAAI
jgi:predicted helicase